MAVAEWHWQAAQYGNRIKRMIRNDDDGMSYVWISISWGFERICYAAGLCSRFVKSKMSKVASIFDIRGNRLGGVEEIHFSSLEKL